MLLLGSIGFVKRFLLLFAAVLLAGCASGMLPGKIYSLKDASQLEFAIEKSRGRGAMTARNPATGETFEGRYTAIMHGGQSTITQVSTFNPARPISPGNMPGMGASAYSITPPTHATARGILLGDKGTVISVWLEIQPGFPPRGSGEGKDNQGNAYQIQF